MTGNNPKLGLVNIDYAYKIWLDSVIRSQDTERKQNFDVNQGHYSVKIMQKTTCNNPKLGLVNVDVHTKFGQILSNR